MQKQQSGFGVVEVILIVVVLALVGVGGWYVWNASQKSNNNSASTNSGNNQVATDPYAGWKSYCDSTQKVCFKYPADWSFTSDASSATVENSGKTVVVSYVNSDTRDGAAMPYYAAAVENLAVANASFKVLGGYVVPSSGDVIPRYKVVDAQFAAGLIAGRQGSTTNTARFTNSDGSTGHLEVYPTNASGYDADKAKAWFASDDAKTADLIARSFYLQ
jgi:Tfp pilus assembly protein PilE